MEIVRDDNGDLQTEAKRIRAPKKKRRWTRFPFVRGVVSFVMSIVLGMKSLLRSSEVAIVEDEEPSKLTKWMAEHWKISLGELAERIDLTPANLSILKTGKAKAIRFSTLEAICRELECQPGDLLEYRPDSSL